MNDVHAIDYEPLKVEKRAYKLVLRHYRTRSVLTLLAAVALGLFIPVLGLCVILIWFIVLFAEVSTLKSDLWESFAIVNDWPINTVSNPYTLIPLSLQFGYDQTYSDAITAQLGIVRADMVVYGVTVGKEKSEQELSFTIARITLPVVLPHILLRAKGDKTDMRQDFVDYESLQLEGDFGDYFTLEVEKGQEVDVLEVITPDVMQTLVDYSQHEDIEIAANNLYFIVRGDARSLESIKQLIESVVSLSGRIIDYTKRITPVDVAYEVN
jgi:hypothetical protein